MEKSVIIAFVFASITLCVNMIAAVIVVFKLRQQKTWKSCQFLLFSVLLVHILFAVSEILAQRESKHKDTQLELISFHVAIFLHLVLCFHVISFTILSLAYVYKVFQEKIKVEGKETKVVTFLTIGCWMVSILLFLPSAACINTTSSSVESRDLVIYYVIIWAVIVVACVASISVHGFTFCRYRHISDKKQYEYMQSKQKFITMSILLVILYLATSLPYGICLIMYRTRHNFGLHFLWIDKTFLPVVLLLALNGNGVVTLFRRITSIKDDSSVDLQDGVGRKINFFTHVQPAWQEVENAQQTSSYV